MNPDQLFGLILVAVFVVVVPAMVMFGIPLAKAWARRLEAGGASQDGLTSPELDELRRRVAELEERADFTERVLARQQEPERLGRGET